MIKITCHYCQENWFVSDEKEELLTVCPFCSKDIYHPKEIAVTSIETAILKILTDCGTEVLTDTRKFFAYFGDVAYAFPKERRILVKACDDRTLSRFYELSKLSMQDAGTTLKKIESDLIDEGISEIWAKKICDTFFNAIFSIENLEKIPESKGSNFTHDPPQTSHETPAVQPQMITESDEIIFSFADEFAKRVSSTFGHMKKYARIEDEDLIKFGTITLPQDVHMLYLDGIKLVPEKTFVDCSGLKIVCVSSNVYTIAKDAFINCNNLEYIIFIGENKQRDMQDHDFILSPKRRIYCSVKDNNLRRKFFFNCQSYCQSYDYGMPSTEKADVNNVINLCKKITRRENHGRSKYHNC